MPGRSNAIKSAKPIGINKKFLVVHIKCFHSVRPPTQSLKDVRDVEKTVDDVDKKMDAECTKEMT